MSLVRGVRSVGLILGLHPDAKPAVIKITFDIADRRAVDALHDSISAALPRTDTG